jgi:hypothetical protein
MNLQKIEFTKTIISKVSYPHAVIPGLQACPGMIEAGGIHWLLDSKMDSCFRRNYKLGGLSSSGDQFLRRFLMKKHFSVTLPAPSVYEPAASVYECVSRIQAVQVRECRV